MLYYNSEAIKADTYHKLMYCTVNIKNHILKEMLLETEGEREREREQKGLFSGIVFIHRV